MMPFIVCLTCGMAIRVIGDANEAACLVGERSDFWPDHFVCPSCGGAADGMKEVEVEQDVLSHLNIKNLTPQEAFAAFNGLGLPEEQLCGLEAAAELFKRMPIKSIVGKDIPGTTRCAVYEMQLTDGTRVCFSTGPHGPCIYKIVRPQSYAEKASA